MRIDWADLAAALGLLLVAEGILPFVNPRGLKRALAALATSGEASLRTLGFASMVAGLMLLWLVRA